MYGLIRDLWRSGCGACNASQDNRAARFVATGSPAASAVMLAAAVTAGVTSPAVRVPPAEIFPAAVEALRRMPAASHVEAARTPAANGLGSVPATKKMEATRVRWFSG